MLRRRWPDIRAGLIAFAIAVGLVEGCPVSPPSETPSWQRPIADLIRPVQRAVLTPVAWIPQYLRFSQRWALFQAASPDQFSLEIDGFGFDGSTHSLYRAGAGDDPVLEYRRIRGAWNPTLRAPGQYGGFTRWFADRLLRDRADLATIRFRMETVVIDDGVPRGTGTYVHEVFHRRRPR